ncbi:hypothetical protein HMPREF9370_0032 [Neisseria wadsworthii 9715]|uniref:Uncharacterized protein n=1 Tax=Neisseria wadsworthii 9715 TaxID=1030841 RepID=G4CLS3_9NEIS|nr:hypothetical protein HMPREF9370_0032 [Neisseria wadsworthii 9715]
MEMLLITALQTAIPFYSILNGLISARIKPINLKYDILYQIYSIFP